MQDDFLAAVRRNCHISDARDNGIYSMCMLFLRLRNLYKWEQGMPPWQEPEPPVLLDWIAAREEFWEEVAQEPFDELPLTGQRFDPFDRPAVNTALAESNLVYGAGYGRQMKSVFFLARKVEEQQVEGWPTLILDQEEARELASPFAMSQDGAIYFRKQPFRFFLWDRIQEAIPSSKEGLHGALEPYGLLKKNSSVDLPGLRQQLDHLVEREMTPIIHHEVGEMQEVALERQAMETIYTTFPDTAAELFVRGLKDILADLHPKGMLGFIIAQERASSLGFYLLFLDGLRKILFPELGPAYSAFRQSGNWELIRQAGDQCLTANSRRAETLADIAASLTTLSPQKVAARLEKELLCPLGMEMPQNL